MMEYRATIDEKESNFWFNQAKKQSFHKIEKDVVYDPNATIKKEVDESTLELTNLEEDITKE